MLGRLDMQLSRRLLVCPGACIALPAVALAIHVVAFVERRNQGRE
jgi:hypothetical protein